MVQQEPWLSGGHMQLKPGISFVVNGQMFIPRVPDVYKISDLFVIEMAIISSRLFYLVHFSIIDGGIASSGISAA